MKLLATAVWKEWRDQRVGVIAFGLMVPTLFALAFLFVPGKWASAPLVPTVAAFGGFAIAALAIGADLVPGELRRNRLAFVARLPIDLRGLFVAKLLFFVAALGAFAAWTYLCATTASATLRHGPWFPAIDWSAWFPRDSFNVSKGNEPWGWIALACATWIFAVSCWLPRGTLAFPAALASLAAWLSPIVGAFWLHRGMQFHAGELNLVAAWLAFAGLLVAALSFTKGLRHGGPWRSRLTWCAGSAFGAFVPLYGWAELRVVEFCHVDPSAASFRMAPVALGTNGRYAFVTGYHDLDQSHGVPEWSAAHALVVDLEQGTWREAGEPGQHFECEVASGMNPWPTRLNPSAAVLLVEESSGWREPRHEDLVGGLDATTAQPLTAEQWKPLLVRPGVLRTGLANRAHSFLLMPDGRRCWSTGKDLYTDDVDGRERKLPGAATNHYWFRPIGLGFSGETSVYDCTRERVIHPPPQIMNVEYVRAGKWLVHAVTSKNLPSGLMLWDPDSDTLSPLLGVDSSLVRVDHHTDHREYVIAMVPDGRLLVVSSGGSLLLVDPESGARSELKAPAEFATKCCFGWSRGFLPSGELVLTLNMLWTSGSRPGRALFARLDWHHDQIAFAGPFEDVSGDLLGCPDRDTLVVVDDSRRIVRAHFDGRPTETLFPRPSAPRE
jgi:hypothetical protein